MFILCNCYTQSKEEVTEIYCSELVYYFVQEISALIILFLVSSFSINKHLIM